MQQTKAYLYLYGKFFGLAGLLDGLFDLLFIRLGVDRSTLWVIFIAATMMVVEITTGLAYGFMALLADGLHMGSHTAALGTTTVAYVYTRRRATDSASVSGW